MSATELTPLDRVAAINGNVLVLSDALTVDSFTEGMRLVFDDDRYGRSPRAGFATVKVVDFSSGTVTVDSAAAVNAVCHDYIFKAPPTEAELLERRVAALEQRVVAPCPESFPTGDGSPMTGLADFIPPTPAPADLSPSSASIHLRRAIARCAAQYPHCSGDLPRLADALRAVEGR